MPRPRTKLSLRRGIAAAGFAAIIAGALVLVTADHGQFYPNVFIAGRNLGGRERHLVPGRLFENAPIPAQTDPVTVRVGDASHRYALKDTGISFSLQQALDRAYAVGRTGSFLRQFAGRLACHWRRTTIAVPPVFDADRAQAFVRECARRLERPPVNASLAVSGSKVSVTPGRQGVKLDAEDARGALAAWANAGGRGDLLLPAQFRGPTVTADRLKAIDTVFATVRTSLAGSSRNRRHNVALAAAAVDGSIVAPGATFSYNEVVGPRSEETGYRKAPVIRGGKLVPGTGGGACQLSSTLYQAALRGGLQIVRRSHHSQPVHYTPAGLDATVVYGAIDLKFRNPLGQPVALRARVEDGRLTCQVLGHGPAVEMELVRQVQRMDPPESRVIEDPALGEGERVVAVKAREGLRVRVLRSKAGAAAEAEVISTDYYAAEPGVIRQGRAPVAPSTSAADAGAEAGLAAGKPAAKPPAAAGADAEKNGMGSG